MLNPEFRKLKKSENNSAPLKPVLRFWIRDPVPFWPLDPGWVKKQDPDPGWKSRIIFPRAWKQFFGLKILEFFDADPDPGSGINIPDPQHWLKCQLIILIPEVLATHFYNLCVRVPAAGGFRHCQPQRFGVQQQEAQVRYGNPALNKFLKSVKLY